MDQAQLVNEVLELTIAYQQGDATDEERARLERLLSDNPEAVGWYLRIVQDTLALCDATAGKADTRSQSSVAAPAEWGVAAAASHTAWPGWADGTLARWLALAAVVGFVLLGARWRWGTDAAPIASRSVGQQSAQVVNASNVRWSDGAQAFSEWSLVNPGDVLRFESGLVNLFLANGAELLVEGPADLEFVSLEKVVARQGKLAARVGPGAIGFSIETPHANVIDRGTSFGLTVNKDCRTAVVVYDGKVDLDVIGGANQPRRRLETGEALSVDRQGRLTRITTVQSADFLEPFNVRGSDAAREQVITAVSDNVRSLETAKYYRIVPRGFREDCRAYVDRLHEWNGLDERGLPPFLVGGDYVMTFNDDKIVTGIEIAVTIGQPAYLYVLVDDRVPPPDWLTRDFVDTHWDLGSDDGWEDQGGIVTGIGSGQSIDHNFSVWRREVREPTTVILGPLTREASAEGILAERSMYGIVAVPWHANRLASDD